MLFSTVVEDTLDNFLVSKRTVGLAVVSRLDPFSYFSCFKFKDRLRFFDVGGDELFELLFCWLYVVDLEPVEVVECCP